MTVVTVTVVTVTEVIFVTVVIVTVAKVAAGTVVIVTYFSTHNLTPQQQLRYFQGGFSRFSRCFLLLRKSRSRQYLCQLKLSPATAERNV